MRCTVSDPGAYEKIISKLLEYNEKVNDGKEISVVEYLKRIDMNSDFAKTYEEQVRLIATLDSTHQG